MGDDEKLSYKILTCTWLFILISWLSLLFHETGHYLAARIIGVPSAQIDWVWIFYIVPATVKIQNFNLTTTQEFLFYLSGGFTAGIIFALLTIIFWIVYRGKSAEIYWWIGTFAFTYSIASFFACYQETVNHANYLNFKYLPIEASIIFGLPIIMGIYRYRSWVKSFINKF